MGNVEVWCCGFEIKFEVIRVKSVFKDWLLGCVGFRG